jgi:hypothetical protein
VALSALAGCSGDPTKGYTMASQFPEEVSTVAVPIWQRGSDEFSRDYEIQLTEAVKKAIPLYTHYRISDKAHADTILTGTLVGFEQTVLSFNPNTGQAREMQIRMTVDFTWKDLRTGKIRVDKKGFRVVAEYIPSAPFNEIFFQGSQDAINKAAERIVEQLAKPW